MKEGRVQKDCSKYFSIESPINIQVFPIERGSGKKSKGELGEGKEDIKEKGEPGEGTIKEKYR